MGAYTDPKVRQSHDQIQQALYYSSRPDYQTVCVILNGMTMGDMLDELSRIKGTGHLDRLADFAKSATDVNNDRLRAAMGAVQDNPPSDLNILIAKLPADQQRAIKSVIASTQAPANINPQGYSRYYLQTRLLPTYVPPPAPSTKTADGKPAASDDDDDDDDDEAHLAADIASAITANSPVGKSPATYTVTVVYRNLDFRNFGNKANAGAILHEPSVNLQISPDPNSQAAVTAAISLVNLHLKRHWGLIKPDIEVSLGAQAGVQNGAPTGSVQTQIEVHVTTRISITLSSSLGAGPPGKPGDAPDRGSYHFGDKNVDMSFTPFSIGILGHWDPPK
jgi:hypothetical protein